jgi:signal transduction histidine kinase
MKITFPLKVLVPLALGVLVSLGILAFAELGYRRLETANRLTSGALAMQAAVNDVLARVTEAEAGQRGFLLTGDTKYLQPYRDAIPRIDERWTELRQMINDSTPMSLRNHFSKLNNLIGRKLAELEMSLAVNEKSGREAAFQVIDTGIGQKLMSDIRAEAGAIDEELAISTSASNSRWTRDLEFARVGMLLMTGFTVILLLVVMALSRRELRLREQRRQSLADDRTRLESEVDSRTAELTELSNYLQTVREEEKSRLARDIHDELGGILVGAKMDVAWAHERARKANPELVEKLQRALAMLDEGVEMKRRIIEELRPTLLDNLGLTSAIDWQARQTCERAGLRCELNLGDNNDSDLPPNVAIALYRIVQEALTNVVKYAKARSVSVDFSRDADGVSLVFHDDGIGLPAGADVSALSHGIAGMRQRVRALKGEFSIRSRPGPGTTLEVYIPLPRRTREDEESALGEELAIGEKSFALDQTSATGAEASATGEQSAARTPPAETGARDEPKGTAQEIASAKANATEA